MNGLPFVEDMKAVENVAIIGAGNMGSGIAQKKCTGRIQCANGR